jgi:hypothetical protein
MLATRTSLGLTAVLAAGFFANCGAELDPAAEDLGPYAEQMPWAEYMATAAMDTVAGAAASTACTTGSIRGLSDQIVEEMNCIKSGLMTDITSGYNVSLGSAALPYLQNAAAAALKKSTSGRSTLALNSTLRTVAQQWILYSWYQTGRCGVSLAAKPGNSNHEDGRAFDTSSYSTWKPILEANGFRWLGSSDPVHFDLPTGADAQGVKAFQRLWNKMNPGDKISEDGAYGPQTETRIKQSPRVGFASYKGC